MVKKIVDQRDIGDKFKRNFVIFVVSYCLNGNANGNVNQRILRSLVDLKSIREFNWCRYTLQKLCEAVIDWKGKSTGYFTGSILFLMMCYLNRVIFRTMIVDRVFPTIKGWSDKIVKTRERNELSFSGFGKCSVVGRTSKDQCASNSKEEDKANYEETQVPQQQILGVKDTISIPSEPAATISLVSSLAKKVVDDFAQWDRVMMRLNSMYPTSSALNKMKKSVSNAYAQYAKSPNLQVRDESNILIEMEDFYEDPKFLEEIEKIEKQFKMASENVGKSMDFSPPSFSLGLTLECGFDLVVNISRNAVGDEQHEENLRVEEEEEIRDGFEEDIVVTKKQQEKGKEKAVVGSCELPVHEGTMTPECGFNVVLDIARDVLRNEQCENSLRVEEEEGEVGVSEKEKEKDVGEDYEKHLEERQNITFEGQEKSSPFRKDEKGKGKDEEVNMASKEYIIYEKQDDEENIGDHGCGSKDNNVDIVKKKRKGKKKKESAKRRVLPDRRKKELPPALSSPFWIRHVKTLKSLSLNEKVLTDYVFNDSLNLSETLYKDGDYEACRAEFMTLASKGKLDDKVFQIWCYLLNEDEQHCNKFDVHRIYFSSRAYNALRANPEIGVDMFFEILDEERGYTQVIDMKKAQLFLFLMKNLNGHHLIICFNFKASCVDIIDSIIPNKKMKCDYEDYVKTLKDLFSTYLTMSDLKNKTTHLESFDMRILDTNWSSIKECSLDDLITMRHLEMYKGEPHRWEIGLKRNDGRTISILRVKYCFKIITSNMNLCQSAEKLLRFCIDDKLPQTNIQSCINFTRLYICSGIYVFYLRRCCLFVFWCKHEY